MQQNIDSGVNLIRHYVKLKKDEVSTNINAPSINGAINTWTTSSNALADQKSPYKGIFKEDIVTIYEKVQEVCTRIVALNELVRAKPQTTDNQTMLDVLKLADNVLERCTSNIHFFNAITPQAQSVILSRSRSIIRLRSKRQHLMIESRDSTPDKVIMVKSKKPHRQEPEPI